MFLIKKPCFSIFKYIGDGNGVNPRGGSWPRRTPRAALWTCFGACNEILNAVLFVLIGMEVPLIAFTQTMLVAGLVVVVVVVFVTLLARWMTGGVPLQALGQVGTAAPLSAMHRMRIDSLRQASRHIKQVAGLCRAFSVAPSMRCYNF